MAHIARVIVDLSLDREFDYEIPEELVSRVQVGSQVVVPFGPRQSRGFVVGLSHASAYKKLKKIKSLESKTSLIPETLMKLATWIAAYYYAPIEQAVRTILPSAVRKKGAKFKEQLHVVPTEMAEDEGWMEKLRKKAPKQAAVLDVLAAEGPVLMSRLIELSGTTSATVRALEAKGFLEIGSKKIFRDPHSGQTILQTQPLELMPQQTQALGTIKRSIETLDPSVVLLQGVTGSGKTEVYLQAIQVALDRGQGAIVLVPEIALTPQMVERFVGRFGDTIAVLHSHLSSGERHDEWHRVHLGEARIAIGARSALFAPVKNPGLIVVDEEHEHTYKQEEAPRYNARDVAVMRGHFEKCAVVLGSATPALESHYNVMEGKYHREKMVHRVDHRKMPHIRVVDMRIALGKEGGIQVLSPELVAAIDSRLNRAEQVILFLNRRGFSTSLICPKCGFVCECDQCSISLTYHKGSHDLKCHICGDIKKVPNRCPQPDCQDPTFKFSGLGIQRVEEVVQKVFPRARVLRMDSDTTTRKGSHARYLDAFRRGEVDILVGTQMIAKGLDFPNVTLVGVVYADSMLHMPDFRSGERTYQLLTQVAGRSGRGDVPGEVIVQTFTPFDPSVQAARRLDFEGFADQEMEFRKELFYPPFCHLIALLIKGPSEPKVSFYAEHITRKIEEAAADSVIVSGPAPAPIAKIKGFYRFHILLRGKSVKGMSSCIREVLKDIKWPDKTTCTIDVDALSIM